MSDDVRVDKKAEIRSSDFSEWKNQPRHFVRDRFIRLEKRAETRYFEQSIHRDKPGKFQNRLLTKQSVFAQKNVLPLTPCRTDKALAVLMFCKGNQNTAEKRKENEIKDRKQLKIMQSSKSESSLNIIQRCKTSKILKKCKTCKRLCCFLKVCKQKAEFAQHGQRGCQQHYQFGCFFRNKNGQNCSRKYLCYQQKKVNTLFINSKLNKAQIFTL